MGYNHPELLESNPFYDDFDDTKNFLRILFKPGYAVQSRELTQLQTLLQNQIAKLGSHIFKDGSQVFGGGITLSSANYIRLSIVGENISNLKGKIIKQSTGTSSVRAKIVDVFTAVPSVDPYTILIIQYLTGNTFTTGSSIVVEDDNSYTITYNSVITDATGTCQFISVESGIFYVDGFFVNSDPQTVTLYRLDNGVRKFNDAVLTTEGVTNRIGFNVNRTVVSALTDSSLNDPARGFYNYNAPGADRYVINLVLSAQEFNDQLLEPGEHSTLDFVELARVVKGVLDYVKKVPTYAELVDTLARRTYDESGNYTVKPFELEVKNHYRNDIYDLGIRFTDTSYASKVFVGDYIVILTNEQITKKGLIKSITPYIPLSGEIGSTDIPTHVISVTREQIEQDGVLTYNYPFFQVSSGAGTQAVHKTTDLSSGQTLGNIVRVTVNRDPNGVYSPEEGGVDSKYVLSIKPGKAYVFGYEFETINNTNIVVDKQIEQSIIALNDYNLGSNVGNYFIVKANLVGDVYKFNNWTSNINLEDVPYMKFGGNYIRITIPYQQEITADHKCKYWSKCAPDQIQNDGRSVLFVTSDTGLTRESNSTDINDPNFDLYDPTANGTITVTNYTDPNTSVRGFIRPQLTNEQRSQYIGGMTSSLSYEIVNMSTEVEINISRLVFTEAWHGNFLTSYDIDSETTASSTYVSQTFPVKQIKCTDTSDPTKIEVVTGNALRWVPASSTGASSTSGSALFVKVLNSKSDSGATDSTAHFNIEDGVVFSDPLTTTNPISYGSSISYISRESGAKKIIITNPRNIGCQSDVDCDNGQGGFYSVGDTVTQSYTKDGANVTIEAEIVAIGGDFNNPNEQVELYVQISAGEIYGTTDAPVVSETVTNLGCLTGPCGLYRPIRTESLDNPTCGCLIRIGFYDSENSGEYEKGETVFQYDYLALGQDSSGNPRYLNNDLVKGTVVSWSRSNKELVVLETHNRFEIANGTIYQLNSSTSSPIKYGGRGWDTYRTKHQKLNTGTAVVKGDIEKISGIFMDIAELVSEDYIETGYSVFESGAAEVGENIRQIIVPEIDNIVDPSTFTPYESVYQGSDTSGSATGVIISIKGRAVTDVTNTEDIVLVIQPTNNIPFTVGSPSSGRINSYLSSARSFDVSGVNTKLRKEIIGCGRLRLLKKQSDDAYEAYFFDIRMDYLPDNSRKYNLNEVFYFFYEEEFKNELIYGFETETEDLQLINLEDTDYVFNVHPEKGIDENLSNNNQNIDYSRIFDTNRNTLLFKLPGSSSIRTVGEMDYRIQKQFNKTLGVGSTSITFSTGMSKTVRFIGGESDSQGRVDASDLVSHYTLIINGDIVDLTEDYIVVTNNYSNPNSEGNVVITKTVGTFPNSAVASLICNLNINSDASQLRIKEIKRKTEMVTLKKTKLGSYKALLSNADIISLDKVTLTENSTSDIKHQFELFNGQTDNIYDLGQITLKNEYLNDGVPSSLNVWVSYRYFNHSGSGPITIDSYPVEYKNIPYYTSPSSGLTYKLDSVIDLRPVKNNTGAIITSSKWIPSPAASFDVDFEYYLSRAYKLVVTRDLKFRLISGIPAFIPELPPDDQNAMTLYDIVTQPYVFDRSDVTATMINNRRYTMKDIIQLDERIQALEKFTALNSLEQQAQLTPILDENNSPRVVSAILVDNFNSHSRADTLNAQYNISIDPLDNTIRAPFKMHSAQLELDTSNSTGYELTSDNIVINDYTTSSIISQLSFNTVEKINQFNDISWIGNAIITPSSDAWFDEEEKPDVRINEYGVNDPLITVNPSTDNNKNNGFGMEWGIWQTKWHGKKKDNKNKSTIPPSIVPTNRKIIKGLTQDEKVNPTVLNSVNTFNVGENLIVDKSVIPFVREKTITVEAKGLKPYTTVYAFFDDVDITSECSISDGVGTSVSGSLKTSSNGSLIFNYTIPKGKFKAGEKLLTITDSSNNDESTCTTIAEATYTVTGAVETSNSSYISTGKSTKKPSSYNKNISDPVAQTFFIDELKYPEGIFVESIDIFFATKDSVLPVTLEIRPTNNGYPASREDTTIYPYASVTKDSTDVKVSSDPSTSIESSKTNFKFSTPVHLLPGEHSIVLRSNSSEYSIYVGELGNTIETTATRIAQQSAIGSFFKTQNAGKWNVYENIDLMFIINKCEFSSTMSSIILKDIVSSQIGVKDYHAYMLSVDDIKFNNTELTYQIATLNASQSAFSSNINPIDITSDNIKYLDTTKRVGYTGNTIKLYINAKSNSPDVSPVVDINRLNLVLVENLIENNTNLILDTPEYNGELDPRTPTNLNSIARARYISKIIELEPGFESTNVRVIFAANVPSGTSIQVFLKQQTAGSDGSFDEEPYLQLTPNNPNYRSPNNFTYNDLMFSLPEDLTQPFSKFAIKVCLYSSDRAITPKIKEMRVISVV